jgi:uncharacterized protein (TIGR00730 family)
MVQAEKKQIKTVVVFGGSKFGTEKQYAEDAHKIGELLGQNGFDLIYGGGKSGLMGVFSSAALVNGSKVTGIITQAFRKATWYEGLDGAEEIVVRSLPSRKAQMIKRADACIVLPGGIGTLDEQWEAAALIDMNVAAASKAYLKPIIALNTCGFYYHMKQQMRHAIDKGFIHQGRERLIRSVDTPEAVIEKLKTWNSEGIMRASDVAATYTAIAREIDLRNPSVN